MGKVIERVGPTLYPGDGTFRHNDQPSTYEAAEALYGATLDRRRNYAIIDGKVCESASWSQCCSGCSDDREGHSSDRGGGCHECGYTGRVRESMWFDAKLMEESRKLDRCAFASVSRPASAGAEGETRA